MSRRLHTRVIQTAKLLIPVRVFNSFCPPLFFPNAPRLALVSRAGARRARMFQKAQKLNRYPHISAAAFLPYSNLSGRR